MSTTLTQIELVQNLEQLYTQIAEEIHNKLKAKGYMSPFPPQLEVGKYRVYWYIHTTDSAALLTCGADTISEAYARAVDRIDALPSYKEHLLTEYVRDLESLQNKAEDLEAENIILPPEVKAAITQALTGVHTNLLEHRKEVL